MKIQLEKFVCYIEIYNEKTKEILHQFFNRESFDETLDIERDEFDNDQYIFTGDILSTDGRKYKVIDISFYLNEYKLNESRDMNGDAPYSVTPAIPTNCSVRLGVEPLE